MTTDEALLLSWRLPLIPTLGCLLTGWLYLRGWFRLQKILPTRFPVWRALCFLAGLLAIFVAVASPLDALTNLLLQAHMLQHLMLTMIAPPLLLLGSPMLPCLRGLPKRFVKEGIGPFLRWKPLIAVGGFLTYPVTAWLMFQLTLILWHVPVFYEIALRSEWWHQAEHSMFLGTGILFWWFIVRPWPDHCKIHRGWAIPYLLTADLCNTALAAFLSFYEKVLYPTYENAPRLWNITALQDQAGAGAIMWVPGSAVFLIPVGILCSQLLRRNRGVRPSEYFGTAAQPILSQKYSFKMPRLGFTLPRFGTTMRWIFLLAAFAVVLDGILGPKLSPLNLAGVLPWTYWRGIGVIVLLLAGNLFCMSCPMVLVRDLWRKWFPPEMEWPRYLRNKIPAIVLLVSFFWAYEAFALWDSPMLTVIIILAYFGAAVSIDGFFKGASFCKYVCPIGQYHFVMSLSSPRTVTVREPEACLSCKTHDCIKGNETQRGCELKLFVPRKSGNIDCTACLDCVRACPKSNVVFAPSLPTDDWELKGPRSGVGSYEKRKDLALLIGVLVFGAFFNAAGMVAPVLNWEAAMFPSETSRKLFLAVAALLILLGLPILAGWVCGKFSQLFSGGKSVSPLSYASRFAPAIAPIGGSLWAAHFLFHLFTGAYTALPVFARILGSQSPQLPSGLFGSWLQGFEILLLDAGLLLSWFGIWKIGRKSEPHPFLAALPWYLLAFALWLLAIWIIFQPMEMRGTSESFG